MWWWKPKKRAVPSALAPAVPGPRPSGRFSPITEEALGDAGWQSGRSVALPAPLEGAIAAGGFSLHAAARAFLGEFHGLELDVPVDGEPRVRGFVHLDPLWALCFLSSTDLGGALASLVPGPVCPVGTVSGHSMFLLMSEDGATYLLDRDWSVFAPLAADATTTLELLCDGRNGRVDAVLLANGRADGRALREGSEREHWGLDAFPDVMGYFPPASLEPARRPPTVHAMPKAAQDMIRRTRASRRNFGGLTISNGGFIRGHDGQVYYAAHTENVLAIREAAPFQVAPMPPNVPFRPIRAGECVLAPFPP